MHTEGVLCVRTVSHESPKRVHVFSLAWHRGEGQLRLVQQTEWSELGIGSSHLPGPSEVIVFVSGTGIRCHAGQGEHRVDASPLFKAESRNVGRPLGCKQSSPRADDVA